jgi:hypothetical protein
MTEPDAERAPRDDDDGADRDDTPENEPDAGPWAKTSSGDADSPGGD